MSYFIVEHHFRCFFLRYGAQEYLVLLLRASLASGGFSNICLDIFLYIKRSRSFQSKNIIICLKAMADKKITLGNYVRVQACRPLGCQDKGEARLPTLPEIVVNNHFRGKAFSLCGYENVSLIYKEPDHGKFFLMGHFNIGPGWSELPVLKPPLQKCLDTSLSRKFP